MGNKHKRSRSTAMAAANAQGANFRHGRTSASGTRINAIGAPKRATQS